MTFPFLQKNLNHPTSWQRIRSVQYSRLFTIKKNDAYAFNWAIHPNAVILHPQLHPKNK
jgi:hypothetical protein